MDLSQLAGKIELMSGCTSLFSPSFQSSNYEPTNKRKEFFSPDEFRSPKMPRTEPPLYNTGWERITMNERTKLEELMRRVKGPFTPLQWMELEHQALIYKYLNARAPIPSSLLVSICKSLLDPSSTQGSLPYSTTGWFNFNNLSKKNGLETEEEGRCRRTDGKKWRCARSAVAEHKYCERHLIRNRHRSRKPVEQQQPQYQPKHQQQQQQRQEQEKQERHRQARSVCGSDSAYAIPVGRMSLNKEKSTITSLDFKQQLPKYPSILSYEPISSNNTILNFSPRSSYSKNNLSFPPAIPLNCGGIESPSHSHLLQDFIGELTKIKPSQNKKSSQEFDFTQIGPLGEILGNSSSLNGLFKLG